MSDTFKSELTSDTANKYIYQTVFSIQRYKLEELVYSLPLQQAISLIRHCYDCSFLEGQKIYAAITGSRSNG